jgi:hypothetical protein
MFVAGLEVDLEAMPRAGRPSVPAGVLGVVAPIALGMATSDWGAGVGETGSGRNQKAHQCEPSFGTFPMSKSVGREGFRPGVV